MIELLTSASKPTVLDKQFSLAASAFEGNSFIRKGGQLPMITNAGYGNVLDPVQWGLQQSSVSSKTLYSTGLGGILSKNKLKILIRKNRCVIPVNCFCVKKDETVYLIRLLDHRVFGLGGIFLETRSGARQALIITTKSPDILRGICPEIPVLFPAERTDKWLGDHEMHDIFYTADRSGNYWFDFFKVSPMVLDEGVDDVNLLKPLGLSFQQIKYRNERLKGLKIKQDRADRAGRK